MIKKICAQPDRIPAGQTWRGRGGDVDNLWITFPIMWITFVDNLWITFPIMWITFVDNLWITFPDLALPTDIDAGFFAR